MKKALFFISLALIFTQVTCEAAFYPYLPNQTGQSGKVLGTNGTTPSWVTGGGGGSNVPNPSATGQMLYSADGSTWVVLAIGTNGQCLLSNGSPLIPTWGSCGPSLSGNNTWTGNNTFSSNTVFDPELVGGNTQFGTLNTDGTSIILGTNSMGSGGIFLGTLSATSLLGVTCDFTVGSPSDTARFCMQESNGMAAIKGGLVLEGTGIQLQGATGPSFALGLSGAPSGACVSGSMYTRSDGTVGAALYVCYSSVWHASSV